MFVDPENGGSPNAPNRVPRVRGDIGKCPKPKKGACLLIKVVPYSLTLVKKWSKMPVFELIFHTWLLVNQNWVGKRAQSVTRWHVRVQGDIGECPKPKKGAFLSIKVVPYSLIFVEKWSKMPVFELIFHTWLLVNQNWVRKGAQSVTIWHARVQGGHRRVP